MGVPTLIIDKAERPGDQWRGRYKSLCLHDPVWYDHMPYLPFPDHWPVFTPKDQIGDWLEMYTKVMELNYWPRTECLGATFDEETGRWIVEVLRNGEPVTLQPTQLILATGMSGVPNVPVYPGAENFPGPATSLQPVTPAAMRGKASAQWSSARTIQPTTSAPIWWKTAPR